MRFELIDLADVVNRPGPRLKGNLVESAATGQSRHAGAPSTHWLARHRTEDRLAIGPARGRRRRRSCRTGSSAAPSSLSRSWGLSDNTDTPCQHDREPK